MTQTKGVTAQTFEIAKCILHLKQAGILASTIAKAEGVTGYSTSVLKRVSQRCDAAVKEFTSLLTPASLEIMNRELLPDETALQYNYVCDMFLACPPGIKDEIESYVSSRYNLYKLNS